MAKLLALLLTSLISIAATAMPEVEEALVAKENKVGLAVIALSDKKSISSDNRAYQRIIGNLQKQIKKNDFHVFNAMLPADKQPDWALDLEAVSQSVETLDNPYINSMILVDASVTDNTDDTIMLSLKLRLFDVTTQTVYRELSEERKITVSAGQAERFVVRRIENELVQLSQSLIPEVISSVHHEYEASEIFLQVADR